jgi:hypothetical protein
MNLGDMMMRFEFQNKKKKNYFEGWYLRFTDSSTNQNYALIFAMTKDKEDPHAFIQYYDGVKHTATYYRYQLSTFSYNKLTNEVSIGDNTLSPNKCHFEEDGVVIDVDITHHIALYPYKKSDSAMGYMSNLPLECFQEVIFMKAETKVTIQSQNNTLSFSGNGYMEKTYGTNFPQRWIWLQSNYSDKTLLSFSVGKVPLFIFKKLGFFLIFHHNNMEYRYSTYNFSKIDIKQDDKKAVITITKKQDKIILEGTTNHPVKLIGPRKNGKMDLPVYESINGKMTMKFYQQDKLIFEDTFKNTGIELMYKK